MIVLETIILGIIWYQVIAVFGLSIGLHRYLSHKQFHMSKTFEIFCLFLAMLAGSRSPLGWAGAHRLHHRYADTDKDPHSPLHKGFWTVALNQWKITSIPRQYIKDLFRNPRVMFFHRYWKYIHISTAIVVLSISVKWFFILIVIPYLLGFFGYGIFNALGHKDGKPVTNRFINLLSAGEGYHNVHHGDPSKVRLHRFDVAGIIAEKFFK